MIDEILDEQKRIVKVNSKGEKRRRIKCRPGYRLNDTGTSCVPMTGGEKATKRKAIRKMVRSKLAQGRGLVIRANRKRARAMKRRKALGY